MLRAAAVAIAFAALTLPLMPVQWLAVRLRLPLRCSLPVAYHRLLCRLLRVRVKVAGARAEGRVLVVANHVSWLDIVVLSSIAPVVFVAKREVASWPVVGWLAKLQRSVFVDRERRHATRAVNSAIAERLTERDAVVLFAEGTSSDGNRVLPFRSALIGAAHAAVADGSGAVFVQPLAIAYVRVNGVPAGRQHRPLLAWYGGMELLPHLGRLIRLRAIDATVTWGEPIPWAASLDRKTLAREIEADVRRLMQAALRAP